MQWLRVFAFTDEDGMLAIHRAGNVLGDQPVQIISNGLLHAIVAPEPISWPWGSGENTRAHALVRYHRMLGEATKLPKVVPAAFDCLFRHTSSIQEALGQHQRDILDLLARYGHLRQFSLTVQWDPQIMQPLMERYAMDPQNSLEHERRSTRNHILQQLQRGLQDIMILDNSNLDVVMQALLLVEASGEEKLVERLQMIDRECYGRLAIRFVGPLPACNFARVEIRLPDTRYVREACRHLGVGNQARLTDIKNAYRRKIRTLHPDHSPAGAENGGIVRLTQSYRYLTRLAVQQNHSRETNPDRQWLRCDHRTLRHTPLLSVQRGLTRFDDALIKGSSVH